MPKYTDISSLFTGIASAIRSKTGATTLIKADDFPDEIKNIQTASNNPPPIFNSSHLSKVIFRFVDTTNSGTPCFNLSYYTLDEDGNLKYIENQYENSEIITTNILSNMLVKLDYAVPTGGHIGDQLISLSNVDNTFQHGWTYLDMPFEIVGAFTTVKDRDITVTGSLN